MLTQIHVNNENRVWNELYNDNTFLAIYDFWSEKHWELASSEDFRLLRESSEMIVSSSRLYLRKRWQVYLVHVTKIDQNQDLYKYSI